MVTRKLLSNPIVAGAKFIKAVLSEQQRHSIHRLGFFSTRSVLDIEQFAQMRYRLHVFNKLLVGFIVKDSWRKKKGDVKSKACTSVAVNRDLSGICFLQHKFSMLGLQKRTSNIYRMSENRIFSGIIFDFRVFAPYTNRTKYNFIATVFRLGELSPNLSL